MCCMFLVFLCIVILFFQRVDTGVLSIQNATYAESGDYECIVKSAVGRIATRTQVIIEGPPGPPGKSP